MKYAKEAERMQKQSLKRYEKMAAKRILSQAMCFMLLYAVMMAFALSILQR